MGFSTKKLIFAILLVAALHQQAAVEATKIAYKKPIYGKTNYIKEQRHKLPTRQVITSSGSNNLETTEDTTIITSSSPTPPPPPPPSSSLELSSSLSSSTPSYFMVDGGIEIGIGDNETTTPTTLVTTTTTTMMASTTSSSSSLSSSSSISLPVPCTCGVFLSSQLKSSELESPLIVNELDRVYPCNAIGRKHCQTKCLEVIVQHLPNSANIVCATVGRDCHKERAFLFIKNCQNQWWNTNLQAGREYCCKNGSPYRCPLMG